MLEKLKEGEHLRQNKMHRLNVTLCDSIQTLRRSEEETGKYIKVQKTHHGNIKEYVLYGAVAPTSKEEHVPVCSSLLQKVQTCCTNRQIQ